MALTSGNKSGYNATPSASSFSWSHTQDSGSNGELVVILAIPAVSVSSVTYGGASMTLVRQENTSYSTYWSIWKLAAPATGSNTVLVTLGSAAYNSCSGEAYSFTGCSGVGNTGYNNTQTVGQTTSLTISTNSMIIAMAIGGNSTAAYIEIPDGTVRTLNYTHNVNNFTWGAVSPSLTSGTITVQGGCTAANIMMAVEIQEAVSTTLPTVTTTTITSITRLTASSGGNVTADGGASVTARGVCWNITTTPTIANSKTTDGTGTGVFTSSITGLTPGTIYYVRAYATNSVDTAYGSEENFKTLRRIISI